MIATVSGTLRVRESGRLIVEAAGIGYEIFVPLSTFYRLPAAGSRVDLQIRQVVREDAIMLYGFASTAEKRAFDLLMGVQHVGPKLALAVLSVLEPDALASAITHEDVGRIDAVPGVGAKVAERIVRELRDKISELNLVAQHPLESAPYSANGAGPSMVDDAISALVNLGYKPAEARHAVDSVGTGEGDLETIIRKALAVILGEK
jgi:holliday junction DNA helicase RuvA